MESTRLFEDRKAVSPVIGALLIVAITVILSAVVGSFALGLGESQDTAPQSSWKTDYTDAASDTLDLSHDSGDPMEPERLSVVLSGASCGGSVESPKNLGTDLGVSVTVSAGTTVSVTSANFCSTGDLDLSTATVRLIWEDPDTDDQADSAVLAVWEGPDA